MNIVFEKVGKGRPSKFVVLDDGSKIHYKEWEKLNPKEPKKRGRKAYERDSNGNPIRPEKKIFDYKNLPAPEVKNTSMIVEPSEFERSTFEEDLKKFEFPEPSITLDDVENMTDEEFDEKINNIEQDDMTDEEFRAFINSVKTDMGVRNVDEFSRR